jgi:hypothetical protein
MLFGCSPQKRYQRLIRNHPELIEMDTIWWRDTFFLEKKIFVPEYRDSFVIQRDTLIETKRFIITKYKDKFKVVYKADTLTYKDTIMVEKPVAGKVVYVSKTNWNYIWIFLMVGLAAGVLLNKRK